MSRHFNPPPTLAELPADMHAEVATILSDYQEFNEDPFEDLFDAERVERYGWMMLIFSVPAALVGIVLARKRKIWLCLDCGHSQDQ